MEKNYSLMKIFTSSLTAAILMGSYSILLLENTFNMILRSRALNILLITNGFVAFLFILAYACLFVFSISQICFNDKSDRYIKSYKIASIWIFVFGIIMVMILFSQPKNEIAYILIFEYIGMMVSILSVAFLKTTRKINLLFFYVTLILKIIVLVIVGINFVDFKTIFFLFANVISWICYFYSSSLFQKLKKEKYEKNTELIPN